MIQVNIAEAKAHFSELIQKSLLGEEVIIARDHQPLIRLVPLARPEGKRRPGSGAGLLFMAEDFDAPLGDFQEYMP
ncbi:MAG: type II toxin-antitoxin system Phd/YefM family antitoxin [Desulfovibrionales bacterium]|nr:MAG: type II toxin-antitoxin system Phd/YefM family antitoxin [Desulfovibrionales bacterium]